MDISSEDLECFLSEFLERIGLYLHLYLYFNYRLNSIQLINRLRTYLNGQSPSEVFKIPILRTKKGKIPPGYKGGKIIYSEIKL